MKKLWIPLGILAVLFIAGIVAFVAFLSSAADDLKEAAGVVMADVRSGQWSKIYSESAPEFRQSVSMEQLQKAGEMWSLLGPYVSMGSAQSVFY